MRLRSLAMKVATLWNTATAPVEVGMFQWTSSQKDIRFIRLSSYANNHQQSELIDTTCDDIPDAKTTYIIDDICDSGKTLLYLRKKYPLANNYVLINKNPDIKPDFAPITEPSDLWINFPWE